MGCFLVSAALGAGVVAFRKRIPASWHADWLAIMALGGSAALGVEHVAHGEIVPWPPFLTAMASATETVVMLEEMAMIGIPMALALVGAWAVMAVAYEKFIAPKKAPLPAPGA